MSKIEEEPTEFEKELPKIMTMVRKGKGWTQEELGKKIGTGRAEVCEYEKGKKTPSIMIMDRILKALNLKLTIVLDVKQLALDKAKRHGEYEKGLFE